jgi:nucleotide-binding universal stress UspA family protein
VGLNPGERLIPSADQFAREFAAKLTIGHVTPEMQTYAPGGQFDIHDVTRHLNEVSAARLAELKQQNGVQAEVYIRAGEVPAVLDQAARSTHADLLIIGRRPRPGWYGGSTYPIISASHIPVLSI